MNVYNRIEINKVITYDNLMLLKIFLIYTLLFQFIIVNFIAFNMRLNQILNIIFLLLLIIGIIKELLLSGLRIKLYRDLKNFIFISLAFMFWVFYTFIRSQRGVNESVDFMRFVLGYILVFYVYIKGLKINIISFLRFIFIIINIASIITIFQVVLFYFFGVSSLYNVELVKYYFGGVYRAVGTLGGPVASGSLHFFGIVIASYFWENSKSKTSLASIMLNLISIFVMMSRTALLCTLVYLFFINLKNNGKQKLTLISILFISFFIALSTTGSDFFINRLTDLNLNDPNAGMGRVEIWKANLIGFINSNISSIILGDGINIALKNTYKYSYFNNEDFAHNDYLDILVSGGLIGLVIYLVYCLYNIYILYKHKNDDLINKIYLMNLIYYSIMSNLQPNIFNSSHRWLFLVLNTFAFIRILYNLKINLEVENA